MVDLLFLPWYHFDHVLRNASRTGVQAPGSFWGFLALLVALAVIALIVIERLTGIELPELPMSTSRLVFIAAGAVLGILVIKLLAGSTSLAIGAFVALLLGAGMTYGGYLGDREASAAR